MIKYQLICSQKHDFEAWFTSSSAFDEQASSGQVVCPLCGATDVEKALMAPFVATTKARAQSQTPAHPPEKTHALAHSGSKEFQAAAEQAQEAVQTMRKFRKTVEENAEYVGSDFATEARKMHNEETEKRGIWGKATLPETKELLEDGISVLPIPELPEDKN